MASSMKSSTRFTEDESHFNGTYARSVFETLYFAYRAHLLRFAFLFAIGLIGRIFLLSNANIIGYWVDSFCLTSSAPHLQCRPIPHYFQNFVASDYLHVLIVVTVAGFFLTSFFRIGFSRTSAGAVSLLYDEVTLRTSRLPLSFFDSTPAGRIITRFSSDYGNVFRLFGGPLAEFINIIFDLICMVVLVTIASPYYLIIVFMMAAVNFCVYRANRDRLRNQRRVLSRNRSPSIAHFAETAQGASIVRSFLRQDSFRTRFSRLNDIFLNQKLKTAKEILRFSFQMNAVTATTLFLTAALGYFLVVSGRSSVGAVAVAFSFITLSGATLQMFFEWMAQFEEAFIGVERLDQYLRMKLETGARLPASRQFPTEHPVYNVAHDEEKNHEIPATLTDHPAVEVKNLWFRYRADAPFILKGIQFTLRPGERLGIVGRTGSGKTSLIQALFHLYPVEKGEIRIHGRVPDLLEKNNNTDASEPDVSDLIDLVLYRRSIALISQDPVLFKGTLRENLSLIGNHADEELIEAIKKVGLNEWYLQFSGGLDGAIEERGRNISMGERQLICMARCLLQNAKVIIMDEATSAVDPQSEELLVRATDEFFSDRTQIIVAHRLTTLRYCDRVLWLHDGEAKMIGTSEAVLSVFEQAQLA